MNHISQALTWATLILVVALVLHLNGVGPSASFGVTSGLAGAAWGTIHSEAPCGKRCLQ